MIRNRRSTASALLGLVLGVAVVSAPWVAIDSSIRGLFSAYLAEVVVDVVAAGPADHADNATAALDSVPHVTQVVTTYQDFGTTLNRTGETNTTHYSVGVRLVGDSFTGVANRLGLAWSAPPGPGTIVVPFSLSEDISIGDVVAIQGYEQGRSSQFTVSGFFNQTGLDPELWASVVFLSSSDLARYRSDLNLTGRQLQGVLLAWLDRGPLIDPYDPAGSAPRLERQKFLMENAVRQYQYFVEYGRSSRGMSLAYIPVLIEAQTFFVRLAFTGLALPTFVLAFLLTRVGFDVGLATRRRELAVLRSRGLSIRGVRGFLTVEAAVLALLGGALGLAVGVALSRLFLGAVLTVATGPAPVADFAITSSTIAFALMFGTLLGLGGSWRGIKLLAAEDVVSILKAHHEEEVAIPHKVSRDFLIGGVAAVGVLLLLASASLRGSPFSFLSFLLGLSTAILGPVAPLLLTIAVTRYLTRGTTRPYRVLARLFRPALGDAYPLVEKNLIRSPRRSSNIAAIVTFAIGFVLTILMISASSEAYRMEEVLRVTPADVVVESGPFGPVNNLTSAVDSIRAVSGVAAVTPVIIGSSGPRVEVLAFDATTYLQTVPWMEARHLGGADPGSLMAALRTTGTFAANTNLANHLGLQIGDELFFDNAFGAGGSLRLVSIVPAMAGLHAQYGGSLLDLAYVDFGSLPPGWNASFANSWRFLIRLTPGAVPEDVGRAVSTALYSASYRTQEETRRQALADPAANLFFGFLLSQGQLAVAILVVAIGLFVFSSAAGRREELATLVARGFRSRTVASLLMAEGWVVTILGILLGLFAAFITVGTVLWIAALLNPTPTPVPFVVPATVLVPLGLVVLGVFAAGWLGTVVIRRMDVVSVLKMRGG